MSPRYVDRSRTVADWKCPRARYWGYEYQGRGIVALDTGIELFIGSVVHDALAAIAVATRDSGAVEIDTIASGAGTAVYEQLAETEEDTYAREQATLVEGLIRGFHKVVWPQLIAAYPNIVAIEQEVSYPFGENDDFEFMAREDLLLADDEGHYIEYKTTGWKKESWINQWSTAIQLHSTIRAIGHSLGDTPVDVQIIGLYKGYEAYGKQSSPFCYAYKKNGNPPFTQDQITYDYKPGSRKVPVWELPGGIKAWVDQMPENILAEQFPRTPPIFIKGEMLDTFFRQRTIREIEIREAVKVTEDEEMPLGMRVQFLDAFFPQRFDQCNPAIGRPCEYRKLCHGQIDDPLTQGFEWRTPNHPQEKFDEPAN